MKLMVFESNSKCNKHILLIIMLTIYSGYSFSQTYATEELRLQAEQQIAEKSSKLAIPQSRLQGSTHVITQDLLNISNEEDKLHAFDLKTVEDFFKLAEVIAINSISDYSQDELNRFSNEATADYNKFHFAIANDLSSVYLINKNVLTEYKVNQLERVDNELRIKDCKTCKDNNYRIILHNNEKLILELKPQDEWEKFSYQLTFKK